LSFKQESEIFFELKVTLSRESESGFADEAPRYAFPAMKNKATAPLTLSSITEHKVSEVRHFVALHAFKSVLRS